MFSASRAFRRATAAAAFLMAAGCSAGETPAPTQISCGPSTLGVERSLTLTQDSPALYDLLEPGEVVLTFDDGPDAKRTKPVLDALNAQCTRATFFLLGRNAKANPKGVRQIIEAGHTIGSHSLDHANLAYLPLDEGVQNALDGKAEVDKAAGIATPLFRFPFVAATPELWDAVRHAGLIDVTVNADGLDWEGTTPEEATQRILKKLEESGGKGIILLHDPFDDSDRRTAFLLQTLKDKDYRVVALDQP